MWAGEQHRCRQRQTCASRRGGPAGQGAKEHAAEGTRRLSHHGLQSVSELSRKRLQVEVVKEDERGEAEREEEQVVVVARRVGEAFVRRVKHEARPVHSWSRERRLLAGAARSRRRGATAWRTSSRGRFAACAIRARQGRAGAGDSLSCVPPGEGHSTHSALLRSSR